MLCFEFFFFFQSEYVLVTQIPEELTEEFERLRSADDNLGRRIKKLEFQRNEQHDEDEVSLPFFFFFK